MRSSDATVEVDTFTKWYDGHARTLLRFCARRVGPDAAEDVVAATFLTAYERRGEYDPGRSDVLPWLYGIAVNHLRRHRRDEVRAYRAMARAGVSRRRRRTGRRVRRGHHQRPDRRVLRPWGRRDP